ncbi:hypothetical protein KFL_002070030 [Klebsormidium nitens]|uniref:Uncharacterized protein n=1 Tax=Klebsormidium nitens TaxID=105231 RepID=A0A1Y1I7Y0_KLENI|nr:hypothetical protein KFL_002070030 [Klebsormidium nitens]|eukprot:GAQ84807.1 hypothetical protein KFL_002070030 [Klebsormidium nitens]
MQESSRKGRVTTARVQVLQAYAEFIATVDTSSGYIEVPPGLADVVPPALSESIMIWECYLLVLKKLDALGDSFGVVLSGSPGIGKSAFAPLLLHHLAKKKAKVTYRYQDMFEGDTIVYFDFSDLSAIQVKIASEGTQGWPAIRRLSKDRSIWCVKDGRAPEAQFRGVGRYIVLCSSDVDDYKEFCEVWRLPDWSLQEMQECRRRLYPEVPEETMEKRSPAGGQPGGPGFSAGELLEVVFRIEASVRSRSGSGDGRTGNPQGFSGPLVDDSATARAELLARRATKLFQSYVKPM